MLRLERLALEMEIAIEEFDRTLSKDRNYRDEAVVLGPERSASMANARNQHRAFSLRAQALGATDQQWRIAGYRARHMSLQSQKRRLEEINHILNPEPHSISNASSSQQKEPEEAGSPAAPDIPN